MADDKSSIDKLKKRLYSRKSILGQKGRRALREQEYETEEEWKKERLKPPSSKKKRPILPMFLIASVVFFGISLVFSVIFFLSDSNISPKNIDITVQGPASIGGGDELSLQIAVTNRNSVPIKLVSLLQIIVLSIDL